MFRVPEDSVMTPAFLAKYIAKHKALVSSRFQKNQDAYENRYSIYSQEAKESYKPDNRVSINFAKYLTDTFNGFFCGVPIKTTSDSDKVSAYVDFLSQYNDLDNGNSELSKVSDIHGRAYEMYYVDDAGNIGIQYTSPLESFMIYDDTILCNPLFFVRYYKDSNNVERGSWSDREVVQHFKSEGSYTWVDEPKVHGFAEVPSTEFSENAERLGVFESVLPAIDVYNKALSEKCNDVDYFADAYLKILGAAVTDKDTQSIRSNRIINFEGDMGSNPEVEFLQKPSADSTQEHLLDRLERQIFTSSMIANINDENFGTTSGIAIKYKLNAMSNLAKFKKTKFISGMNRRYKIIFSNPISRSYGVLPDDWMQVSYHFTENYPANISDEAAVAKNLEGVVSKETQLKVLSIVDNVPAEIDRIKEEEGSLIDTAYAGAFSTGSGVADGE